jgi:hypothetical protein
MSKNLLYDNKKITKDDGKKTVVEEFVSILDDKIKIKYFYRDENTSKKIVITSSDGENFNIKCQHNEEIDEKDINNDELVKYLTKNKMEFAIEYIKKDKKTKKIKRSKK